MSDPGGKAVGRVFAHPLVWLVIFAALILATQLGSLEVEVIDWDESTFILIASDLLHGNLPYVGLFDNKSPMIFISLAGAMYLFGESLLTVRLFGDATLLVVAVTTFGVARRYFGEVPAAAAVCALIAASAVPMSQHTQTEHLALAFVMPALWLALGRGTNPWAAALAGVLLSLAALTRMNLAFVVVVLGLYYCRGLFRGPSGVHRASVFYYVIGGVIPLAILFAVYAQQGAIGPLSLAIFKVPLIYASEQKEPWENFWEHMHLWRLEIRAFPVIYGGLSLLILSGMVGFSRALWASGEGSGQERRTELLLIGVVFAATLASVLMSGAAYRHYWNQLLPFAAILIAAGLSRVRDRPVWVWLARGVVIVMVLAALTTFGRASWHVATQWPAVERSHEVRRAAERIAEARRPGATIWAVQQHLILWYLAARPLSPVLAHPSNLFRRVIIDTLAESGYVGSGEADRVFESEPDFIVQGRKDVPFYMSSRKSDNPVAARYKAFRAKKYDLWYENEKVKVYRKKTLR